MSIVTRDELEPNPETTQPLAGQPGRWDSLRALIEGVLITPQDAQWDAARTPWIVNVEQQPAAVLYCTSVEDVVTAVRWGAAHGIPVAAQPTGHAPRRTLDSSLLLRTGALEGIAIDRDRRTARVGAGVKWGELLAKLDGTGLMALAGSNPDPTVVGLVLGGGVSWFTRKHGYTANSVLSFDVVDPTGTLVHVTADTDAQLFWALRGGGGDFGIVVAVELSLFSAPAMYGGRLLWDVGHTRTVLRAFRDLALVAPRELSIWAHVYHFPPMPEIPEPFRGRSFVSVAATYLGSARDAEALLWSLRNAAPVELDLMGALLPSGLGGVAAEPTEPMPGIEHSMLLDGLDDEAIDFLAAVVEDPTTCPLAVVQLRGLGGAFAETAADGGAVRPVTEAFQLFALGVPAVPELAAAIPHGFAAVDAAMSKHVTGRRLPNFTGVDQDDAAGYDATTAARLRELKQARDPHGVIRSNKPV